MQKSLKSFLFISVVLNIVGSAIGTAISTQCASVTTMANVDLSKSAAGTWYAMRAGKQVFATGNQCLKLNFAASSIVARWGFLSLKINYNKTDNVLSAEQSVPMIGATIKAQAWTLDTDYTNYAVLYVCGTVTSDGNPDISFSSPLVLSRTKTLATTYNTKINAALTNNKLSTTDMTTTYAVCLA